MRRALIAAALVLAACASAPRPAPGVYRSLDAALAAHPEAHGRTRYVVDGVLLGGRPEMAPAEVATVEVLPAGSCAPAPGGAAAMDGDRECVVVLVQTRAERGRQAQRGRQEGSLRVRVRDAARGGFVSVVFDAMATDSTGPTVTSAATGWGSAVPLAPGTYRLVLWEYPCGDTVYIPDEAYAEREAREVTIRTGRRTQVDLRMDVREIEADTTLGLPRRCTS
jgi:hypothetical protein